MEFFTKVMKGKYKQLEIVIYFIEWRGKLASLISVVPDFLESEVPPTHSTFFFIKVKL